jgi:histidine ammonia-lyase
MSGDRALASVGMAPFVLEAKEGLALLNGTQFMAAVGASTVIDALRLCDLADTAASMSLEALRGSTAPYDARIHELRPHDGQARVARNVRHLVEGSMLVERGAQYQNVQDPYSLRCVPQVHGASRDAVEYARKVVDCELNSVTDNPCLCVGQDGGHEFLSGGNFHGQPLALALDFLAIAVSELASISERRLDQVLDPGRSRGLPAFLARQAGLHSGFMVAQLTAQSLVSENKVLSHPACVDSMPSAAGQEDHVSMGSVSAVKLLTIIENTRLVLAIEMMSAAEALDIRAPLRPGNRVAEARDGIRAHVSPVLVDRSLSEEIHRLATSLATPTEGLPGFDA